MQKGPNYERIRAMLNGNVSSDDEQERAWVEHYLDLADELNRRSSLPALRWDSGEDASRENVIEFRKPDRDKAA